MKKSHHFSLKVQLSMSQNSVAALCRSTLLGGTLVPLKQLQHFLVLLGRSNINRRLLPLILHQRIKSLVHEPLEALSCRVAQDV